MTCFRSKPIHVIYKAKIGYEATYAGYASYSYHEATRASLSKNKTSLESPFYYWVHTYHYRFTVVCPPDVELERVLAIFKKYGTYLDLPGKQDVKDVV